jgi:hypothetical protein
MKKSFRCFVIIIAIALSGVAISSCEKPSVFEDEDLINSLYQKSVDTLVYESSNYILETELYRNLMPGGPLSGNRPLISILYLTNLDSLQVSDNLKLEKVYVINDKLIYKDIPEFLEDNYLPDFKRSYICREGPEWETEINVDVVIKLIENISSENFYIISRNQPIEKVW